MEGDAGSRRLNPIDAEDTRTAENSGPEVTAEDSQESEVGADADTETDAETDTETDTEAEAEAEAEAAAEDSPVADGDAQRRPSRLNRAWLAGISAVVLLLAGAIAAGGYLALRADRQSDATARENAAALQAAKECISATQAPDINAIAASEQKIIECGTDQYRTQALLYSSMLVQAYQAANVHLQVSDMRGAVERNHPDGSIDVLVALRVKVSNDQAQNQETGYRLRVRMTPMDGTYKISKLDQVTK